MTDWVRLWHDMPNDPKWRTVARKSGQRIGDVIAVFNFLMVDASANALERGRVSDGFDTEDVATALDLEAADVQSVIDAMQGKVLDGLQLRGWQKRQPKREDSTASKRKAEWKERKQNAEERTGTQGNAPETETEEDTEKEEKKKKVTAPDGAALAFKGKTIRLTRQDFDRWREAYPSIDLVAALQSRDDWLSAEGDERTRKRWFIATSNHLANLQQKASAIDREPEVGMPC